MRPHLLKLSSLTWAVWIGRDERHIELTMADETSQPVQIFMRPSEARILARALIEAAENEPSDQLGEA